LGGDENRAFLLNKTDSVKLGVRKLGQETREKMISSLVRRRDSFLERRKNVSQPARRKAALKNMLCKRGSDRSL